MSINIDQLLDKITNENIEINVRNMIIMHNKIQNNLLKLDTLQEKTLMHKKSEKNLSLFSQNFNQLYF